MTLFTASFRNYDFCLSRTLNKKQENKPFPNLEIFPLFHSPFQYSLIYAKQYVPFFPYELDPLKRTTANAM